MTGPGYRALVRQLSTAQKDGAGAPAYSRWINRRIGRYLAAWAYRRALTPNQVTAISALFTFASITALACVRPTWWLGIAVAAGLLLGYAFDSADGQLARLTGTGSPAGEWLDHVVDCIKCAAIHLAVAVCWYRMAAAHHAGYLLIPLGYCVVAVTFFFATILSEQLRRGAGTPAVARIKSAAASRSFLVLAWDYGLLALIFVTLGSITVFGVLYSALALANAGLLLVAARRWYAEMRTLTPPRTVAPVLQ